LSDHATHIHKTWINSLGDDVTKEDSTNGNKPIEMNTIKDIDTISEAGTIKDSDSDNEGSNDNTEVDKSPTEVMNVLQIEESAV